jgi:hypothetical protein
VRIQGSHRDTSGPRTHRCQCESNTDSDASCLMTKLLPPMDHQASTRGCADISYISVTGEMVSKTDLQRKKVPGTSGSRL